MAGIEELITEHIDVWTSAVKRKSSAGRGGSKKIELYGVKKLRALILDLAVRGLLVPQSTNDSLIESEIGKAVKYKDYVGKARRIRLDKETYSNDAEFKIHRSWRWVNIGQIAHVLGGKRVPRGYKLLETTTPHAYIRVTDLKKGTVDTENLKYIDEEIHKGISKYIINSDDVYISIAGTIGSVGTIPESLDGMNLTENCAKLIFKELSKEFIVLALSSSYVQNQFAIAVNQMAQPKLSLKSIKHTNIALPPLEEQHRIVDKVDELMALCDQLELQTESSINAHQTLVETLLAALTQSTITSPTSTAQVDSNQAATQDTFDQAWQPIAEHFDTLFTTEQSIELLKQSILQLAVMGKLVPQDPDDEPASELLKRIAVERDDLVEAKVVKKQRALPEVADMEVPYNSPDGWAWSRMGDLAQYQKGFAFKSKDYLEQGLMITKIKNLTDNHTHNSAYIKPEMISEFNQFVLNKDDIVMTTVGSWFSAPISAVGRSFLINDIFDNSLLNQNAVRIRPWREITPMYLYFCINSPAFKLYLTQEAQGTANQASITQESIKNFLICVPPKEEQHHIVARVEEILTLCIQLKSSLADAQNTQLKLADTVTHQAAI